MDVLVQSSLTAIQDSIGNAQDIVRFVRLILRASTDSQIDSLTFGSIDDDVSGLNTHNPTISSEEVIATAGKVSNDASRGRWTNLFTRNSCEIVSGVSQEDTRSASAVKGAYCHLTDGIHGAVSAGGNDWLPEWVESCTVDSCQIVTNAANIDGCESINDASRAWSADDNSTNSTTNRSYCSCCGCSHCSELADSIISGFLLGGKGYKLSLSLSEEFSFSCELEVGGIEIRLSPSNLAGSLVADSILSFKGDLSVFEVILEGS